MGASYNIGGSYVLNGIGAFGGDLYMGNHDALGGWSRLGNEMSFGVPCDYHFGQILEASHALTSENNPYFDDQTASDCVWIASATGADGNITYYGLQGVAGVYGDHAVVGSITLIASDDMNLSGTYTGLGTFGTDVFMYANAGVFWFQAYNESPNGGAFMACGGKQLNALTPDTYEKALEHIAENPETWTTFGGVRLGTYNGEDLELAIMPDPSTPGGGGGSYDNDSDIIPWAPLPTLGACNSGIVTLYNPTESELQSFANYLWSDFASFEQNITKWQGSVMDLIISLCVVPVDPPTGNVLNMKIGGVPVGVQSLQVPYQYMAVDLGTVNVSEYYGNALDYASTKVSIYLPFVGTRDLRIDEVMGGSVSVRYNIDLFSGACVAQIRCNKQGLNATLYNYEGNLSMQIPLVSRDYMGMYGAIMGNLVGVIGGMATGGATGAVTAGSMASNIMAMKPNVQHAGNVSSNAGYLSECYPFIIIERPVHSYPQNSRMFYGAPSNISAKLGSLKGYTECETVILDGVPCTNEEKERLRQKLADGIIL